MFRNFSFNPPERLSSHSNLDSDSTFTSGDLSPTSLPSSNYMMPPVDMFSAPAASMAELQERFSKHHITTTTNPTIPSSYYNYTRDSEHTSDLTMDLSEHSNYDLDRTTYMPRPTCSSHLSRRVQRQHTSRLQCTPAHLSKLSSLLESMVAQEDQCYSSRTDSTSTSTSHSSASSDAGDVDTADHLPRCRRSSDSDLLHSSPNLRYRRSGDVLRDGPSVVKNVRVRKRVGERRKRISR